MRPSPGRAGASGFGLDEQSGGVRTLAGRAVVGADEHFAKRLAVIEQEAFSLIGVPHGGPEDGGEIGRHIVAAELTEFRREDRRVFGSWPVEKAFLKKVIKVVASAKRIFT